jgi:hypothetical protein
MKLFVTKMLIFNEAQYQKDVEQNEKLGLELPLQMETKEVGIAIDLDQVVSCSEDYAGLVPENRALLHLTSGDSISIKEEFSQFLSIWENHYRQNR